MDVAHYYADVIYLLPSLGITKGAWGLWYSEQLHTNILYIPVDNNTLGFCIMCVICEGSPW